MEADSPDYLVHEIFSSNFWKDHPLGKPILGTRETVKRFDRPMIRDYYTAVYSPSNLLVTAAGNLTHDGLVALVREHFEIAAARRPRRLRDHCPPPTPASPCATRRRWSRCISAWECPPIRCPTRSASPVTC